MQFSYHLPTKIEFGTPFTTAVPAAAADLGAKKLLLISDPGLQALGLVDKLAAALAEAGLQTTIFTAVSSNPTTAETAEGLALARLNEVDTLVALGGGSPIDVAKGIAMLLTNGGSYAEYQWEGKPITKRSAPLIAVPTTAGTGSEVSKVAVLADPDNPFKKGVLSPLMFPHVAVLDPALTVGLPPQLTAATGMDAFVHALEAFVGKRANPYTDQLALTALQAIGTALPQAVEDGADVAAREQMLLASLRAGTAMDHAGLGLVHAISGPLTSHLHLHHGLANSIILPYVMAFNLPAIPEMRLQALQNALSLPAETTGGGFVEFLMAFVRRLGLPTRLSELDISLEGVDWERIAAETTRMVLAHNNPRPATEADCLQLLEEMQ